MGQETDKEDAIQFNVAVARGIFYSFDEGPNMGQRDLKTNDLSAKIQKGSA